MINKTVANYTIKHVIGSGGMSDVYYAENRLGKKAAIKVLKAELCAIGTIKERFEQEARIMVDIEHKNIRQAYDLDEINGQPAIIMEYLEGHTLKQLIDKGKISDAKAQKYFEQCVLALRVTHAKEIVHRDIKPSNIFITSNDEVKILDFGIAKVKESGLGTRTNQMLGTPVYMSPEQIKSPKNVDTKSDVYSLAVTFYHALTGKVPYDSTTDSDYEIHTKIVNEDLDLSKVPSKWATLLNPMLIKAPNQRIAIDKIGGNSGSDITQYDPDPPTPTPKPKPDPKPEVAITSVSIPHWVYYLIGGITLSVAVMLGIRGCGGDSTSELVVYEANGLNGYKDATGSIVIPARYEIASAFSGGRAKVSVADSVYYIDTSGVMVELIKPLQAGEEVEDRDGDGIMDDKDRCPNEYGVASNGGCPEKEVEKPKDSDGDGITDDKDRCPDEYGVASNNGCPKNTIDAQNTIIRKNLYGLKDTYSDEYDYYGDTKSNIPQGEGTATYKNGDKYIGDYVNGKMEGQGTYTYKNGDKYVGAYKNDKKEGQGTYTWSHGDKYVGACKNGKMEGQGTYSGDVSNCPDCMKYSGQWKEEKKHGFGRCYDRSGNLLYEGNFENDKPVGTYPNR